MDTCAVMGSTKASSALAWQPARSVPVTLLAGARTQQGISATAPTLRGGAFASVYPSKSSTQHILPTPAQAAEPVMTHR